MPPSFNILLVRPHVDAVIQVFYLFDVPDKIFVSCFATQEERSWQVSRDCCLKRDNKFVCKDYSFDEKIRWRGSCRDTRISSPCYSLVLEISSNRVLTKECRRRQSPHEWRMTRQDRLPLWDSKHHRWKSVEQILLCRLSCLLHRWSNWNGDRSLFMLVFH